MKNRQLLPGLKQNHANLHRDFVGFREFQGSLGWDKTQVGINEFLAAELGFIWKPQVWLFKEKGFVFFIEPSV